MSLGTLCLGLFLIFYAVVTFGWFAVSPTLIGIVALIAGILILVDAVHPIRLGNRTAA